MVQSGVVFTSQQAHTTLRRTLEDDTNAIKKSVKHNSLLDDLHTSIVLSSQIKLRSINARYWADAHPTSFLFSSFTLIFQTRGGIFTIFQAIASKLKGELSGADKRNSKNFNCLLVSLHAYNEESSTFALLLSCRHQQLGTENRRVNKSFQRAVCINK